MLFTGKGGVGKTSLACASAIALADAGKRVLLVSTDPASNLDEVLGVKLQQVPTIIPRVPGLFAMNIDPGHAAKAYRERMVAPYRGLLPDAAIRSMEEQFSGACTMEIAAFDEFARLFGDDQASKEFEHVILDTAPSGHTLRLLTLPTAWTGYLEQSTLGTSCLGPLAGLQSQRDMYRRAMETLSDSELTKVVLVARGESSTLVEAARTSNELRQLGITNQALALNSLFQATDRHDPYAVAMEARIQSALRATPSELQSLPCTRIAFQPEGFLGVDRLRHVSKSASKSAQRNQLEQPLEFDDKCETLSHIVDEVIARGHGVIMTMGKGGVGKTTIASAIAAAIADRGCRVHLTTTDPAAHLASTLAGPTAGSLTVSRIDPKLETERYSQQVLQRAGSALDDQGRKLLEEDLRSPCTEEIAVFRAFADAVDQGEDKFVVLDTAPTGHTILLLDAALAYHREVSRQTIDLPRSVKQLLPRLRDPNFARILIVTHPEATPVHEAAALQEDLKRAQIIPMAWVINQSLTPLELSDPVLLEKQRNEVKYLNEVMNEHATRTAIVSWQLNPPIGVDALLEMMKSCCQSNHEARVR